MRRSRIHREEVQRSKPEAMPPDGHRSEGTLSLSEVPYAGAKPFGLPFRRLEKVTRCKSETASGSTRRNGYSPDIASTRRNGYSPNSRKKPDQKIAAFGSSYTVLYGLPSQAPDNHQKRSLPPCPIENATAPTANAPSKKATTLTPYTANTIAVKPALTTTRAVKSVQAKAAIAPTPNNRAQKKWSLIRLHLQFQAFIIQPFGMAHRALQSSPVNPDHHGFRLVEVFR